MKIETRLVKGYALGFVQPCLLAEFDAGWDIVSPPIDALFERVFDRFSTALGECPDALGLEDELRQTSVGRFVILADRLNQDCGDQRFSDIQKVAHSPGGESSFLTLALPTLAPRMVRENLAKLIKYIGEVASGGATPDWEEFCKLRAERCRAYLPGGTNAGNFIAAAAKRRIPFFLFSSQHLFLGYGKGTRVLNSSVTDKESVTGFEFANDKRLTNRLLDMAGLPVAKQVPVNTRKQAVQAAQKIGFPLVLKPAKSEQGYGVLAGLKTQKQLMKAFDALSKLYKDVLMEAFVPGRLFRINVFEGQVIRVAERIPATVVGDGTRSVAELIKALNAEPDRGGRNSTKHKLGIDQDVHQTLARQGLSFTCVPKTGQSVPLTSLARVNNGGTARDALSDFHTETLSMIVQAVQTLGLQMAGVDYLVEDPSTDWRENGGVICEINAKPQLGVSHPAIYGDVLETLNVTCPPVRLLVSHVFEEMQAPIFNRSLTEIKVNASPAYLLQNGCPVQYWTEIEYADDVTADEKAVLEVFLRSTFPERPVS